MPTESYLLKSIIRSIGSRNIAARSPLHHKQDLYVGKDKRRVMEGRPLTVLRPWVDENIEELREKAGAGRIQLLTMDKRVVDLATFEVAPPAVLPKAADFTPDSILKDPPTGNPMPAFPGVDIPADMPRPLHIPKPATSPELLPIPEGIPGALHAPILVAEPPAAPITADAPLLEETDAEVMEDVPAASPSPTFDSAGAELATSPATPSGAAKFRKAGKK